MKSLRSYLTVIDRLNPSPSNVGTSVQQSVNQKLYRTLLATTFVAGSQLLAMMSASANPVPTPSIPSPLIPTRAILNGSFEDPAVKSYNSTNDNSVSGSAIDTEAGGKIPESYNNLSSPIIWRNTDPGNGSGGQYDYKNSIEVWKGIRTGNGGQGQLSVGDRASSTTKQYAEINGSTNGSLYQDICVLPSETVAWSLEHAVRNSGQTNIMQVSITNPADWADSKTPPTTQLYNSGDLTTTYSQGWQSKTGTWTSPDSRTFSMKPLRFAFKAIQGSSGSISMGNFIDNVQLNLSPFVDFLPTSGGNVNLASTVEGNPSSTNPPYYYLSLRVNGVMATGGTVQINLTGLNAQRSFRLGNILKGSITATGLSAVAVGNQITLTIPAGTYNPNIIGDYIHIPIDFSNTTRESNDNLTFTLSSATGVTIGSTGCGVKRDTVNTLLRDDDYVEKVELPLPLTVAANQSK
jgi:hypothetical protein